MPHSAVRLTVLGPVRAWRGDTEVDLGSPQQRALLGLLLAHAGQPVTVAEILTAIWGADPPASALNAVRRYIGVLRRLLEPGLSARESGRWLLRGGGGYRLHAGDECVDVLRFRRMCAEARDNRRDNALPLFLLALGLWRGPAGAGLDPGVRAHPAFAALDRERLAAAQEAAALAIAESQPERALAALRDVASAHPLDEPAQAWLIRLLRAAGRQAEATAVFEAAHQRLGAKPGVDPGPGLRAALTDDPAGPARRQPGLARPAQLPVDLPVFTGRQEQLAEAYALVDAAAAERASPRISTVTGMAGVGKTAFAVHWAHRIAGRFPDGQLYTNLRGFDPHGSAAPPDEVLRRFLEALEVPAQQVPADPVRQAALYRSLLAGRRVLVVLDDARDAEQVRPLLPGAPDCFVIVTSRDDLTALNAQHGAHRLSLHVLSADDAREMFERRLGYAGISADPQATEHIVDLCAGLPLALAIVAARAATHPEFPLDAIARHLLAGRGGLDAFADRSDQAIDLRAAFAMSYRILTADAAGLLRRLALHPGPQFDVGAAASLAGLPERRTRPLLAELTRAHLLEQPAAGRFILHDLLRAYATELASADPAADREAALTRLLDHDPTGGPR